MIVFHIMIVFPAVLRLIFLLLNLNVISEYQSIIHLKIPSSRIARMKLSNLSLSTSKNFRLMFIHISFYKAKAKFGAGEADLEWP